MTSDYRSSDRQILFEECYEVRTKRNKKPYLRAAIVALRRNVTFIMTRTVHGVFRSAMSETGWDIETLLTSAYRLFKDSQLTVSMWVT